MAGWAWDEVKNRENRAKHGFGFETAVLVFDDEHAASRPDPYTDEERWNTLGKVSGVLIFVVHTEAQDEGRHRAYHQCEKGHCT